MSSLPTAEHRVAGVSSASRAAWRFQWSVAMAVVVIPFLGVIVASVLLWQRGIGWVELSSLLIMYVVCTLGATVGFHRHFAHRSFQTSQPMRIILGITGSMAVQGPLLFWVATHRRHHNYSDQPGDPHSPNLHGDGVRGMLHGLWHSHLGWMFSREQTDWVHFAKDVMRDRTMFVIHRYYFVWVFLGLALPAAFAGLVTGTWWGAWQGFLWGGLVRIFLLNHSSWCVGSVCHMFGTRPFQTHDHSANNYPVALLTFGEGLQNNHHAFPSSFAHAVKWWEPDFSALFIRLLQFSGLIWDVKSPTKRAIAEARVPQGSTT